MTKIDVTMETTINTGDYNNVKISYGLEDEPRQGEKVQEAFIRVKAFVEKELIESAAQVSEEWSELRKKRYGK